MQNFTRKVLHVYLSEQLFAFLVEKYNWVVNGEAEKQVDEYMGEDHTFEEYCEVGSMDHDNL